MESESDFEKEDDPEAFKKSITKSKILEKLELLHPRTHLEAVPEEEFADYSESNNSKQLIQSNVRSL